MRLDGQVIIVTGGGGGLGLAFVRRLREEGAAVVVADLEAGQAEPLTADPGVAFVRTDVSRAEDARRLADATLSRFGRVDTLINNAALWTTLRRKPFEELTVEEWEQVLSVNVIGAFNCTQAVVPAMRSRGRGRILNIASNVVHKGLPFLLHYVASKGAIVAMTRALARELGPAGITVNAVAPGYVLHEGTARADEGRNETVIRLRALARTQTPEDLCGTIVFLCSGESGFITGQTLVVDGGEVFA